MVEHFTIGIVGYGLIGGSLGIALKEKTKNHIIAIDKNHKVLDYVSERNLADEVSVLSSETIGRCDILFIALYPDDIVDFIQANQSSFKSNAIVVDLCGIKKYITDKIDIKNISGFRYVGTHPMAGKEKNGITSACGDLYDGASFLITKNEHTDEDAIKTVEELAKIVGFDNVIVTDEENHDKMITYTSQLPHIMSVAYIMQEAHQHCFGYYAGSFKDMTRVADINAELWTQLFKDNRGVLVNQINEYIDALSLIRDNILCDGDGLKDLLLKSKELKEWQDENYKY